MRSELLKLSLAMNRSSGLLSELAPEELAAIASDWDMWARPDQLIEEPFTLVMLYQARGTGKTRAIAQYVHREAMSGRANRIVMCAQTLDDTIDIMVTGSSGICQIAPPWEMPSLHGRELHWPNGAVGFLKSAETVEKRGPQYHLLWASEVSVWKRTKAVDVWSNLQLATRLGYARTLVDTNPKKTSPIVKEIRRMAELFPESVRIIGGRTRDNEMNLAEGKVDIWEKLWGGTKRGKEELEGLDADEDGLIDAAWIEMARRKLPKLLRRRIVAIDPATTDRRGSDTTGLVELGLGTDEQLYVIADHTDRMDPDDWAAKAIKLYIEGQCDCLVVETNKGGQLVAGLLRAAAKERGQQLDLLAERAPTRHSPGHIYVKEVFARTSKERRADAAVVLYKAGRISHLIGAPLERLEETLTTWQESPSMPSPGDLDALVWGCIELSGLYDLKLDVDIKAVARAQKQLSKQSGSKRIGRLMSRSPKRESRI